MIIPEVRFSGILIIIPAERVYENDPKRHKTGASEEVTSSKRESGKTRRNSQTEWILTPKGNSVSTSRKIIQEINPGNTVEKF